MPSNAEWEHAARGGARTRFPYGSDKTFLKYYAPFGEAVDYDRTMPVGKLKPNAHGLFDVIGNVDEWCQDEFASFVGETELDYVDLHGGIVNPGRPRVLRGGSYSTGTAWHRLRTAVRRGMNPDHSFADVGFRIVRTVK